MLEIVKALQKQVEGLEGWGNPPMTETEAYTVRGNWGKMKCTTDCEAATMLHGDTSLPYPSKNAVSDIPYCEASESRSTPDCAV